VPDYVRDGATGLLCDAGNPADLTDKLDWIIEHPAARRQYGAVRPPLVRERFSMDVVTRSYIALYERLMTR
jgi:glycosyltransferase involved in cell wall biosynthesis